ncbi:MAG: CehA/McbA family metallohydrolase [Pseudoxanthomonas sp.]|nr:CehA/McbA family metallohydrolase [Pseudoxanthomonas sp.]
MRAATFLQALALAMFLFFAGTARATDVPPSRTADVLLEGTLDGRDHQRYRTVPFDVPAGTERITVQFEYDGREHKTTVDLGLLGPGAFATPQGFRGWSGGNKSLFTVSSTDATPSYLSGTIEPGRWSLLLGIPNIRAGSTSHYRARVWFGRAGEPVWQSGVSAPPLRPGEGWFRGDLHLHDAHSDGSCRSQSGAKVPCPVFLTAQAAVARGLDFIAITDHNTTSHANAIRELQPYFDQLLLMPGREITTFSGHANLFGSVAPLDFRVAGSRDWNAVLRDAQGMQAFVSINHPIRPSDERCMGCGWTPWPAADLRLLQAVEVVNGMDADTPYSGIPFWHAQLDAGHRLTAIGGSDNHDAAQSLSGLGGGAVGQPTTVVHASELSTSAILDGLRSGNVFVDVQGSRDRAMSMRATSGTRTAAMGGAIALARGETARFEVRTEQVTGARVVVWMDGKEAALLTNPIVASASQAFAFDWTGDGGDHWLRADVRGSDGKLWLVGNPVYMRGTAVRPGAESIEDK